LHRENTHQKDFSMRRVVVTGSGFISSLGADAQSTWSAMLEGRDGIGPLQKLDLPLEPAQLAAQIEAFPTPHHHITFGRFISILALEAALQGWEPEIDPKRMGVFQGAGTSGLPVSERAFAARLRGEHARLAELSFQTPCTITDALATRIGARGTRSTIMNACSSSLMGMGQAWEQIANGDLDLAVVGGTETLCKTTYAGFSSLKAVDTAKCRPFSRDRAGLNLGEAAAQMVMEPLEQAQKRGATILAEIVGYGASMDAHHPTAPHPEGEGAARAMAMALRVGRVNADEIDLVSAHGTATPANDGAEALGIKRTLGEAASRVSVTSSKSQFGHTLGAAGAVGASVAIFALRDQVVSPTLRLHEPDPVCGDLDCTPLRAKERKIRAALVNAFAFGGNNVSLALRRWEGR
jgi:3-oxoacyl-[acyl-carrier-protein] synthase II